MSKRRLTHKQERFAQLVADGCKHAEAYRQAYDVSPETEPNTVWCSAYQLASNPQVAHRIRELRQAAADAVAQRRAWDLERLVDEAETNLHGARSDGKWASANGALELIGRATGLLSDKPRDQLPPVTRITVVLNRGPESRPR